MRITIALQPRSGSFSLPVQYNQLLQGFIYRQIDATLATWLHEEAYALGERRFKLFTFSRLTPLEGARYEVRNGTIRFGGPVGFTLSSVNHDLLASLAEHLLKAPQVRLGHTAALVRGVEVLKPPRLEPERPVRVRALSPITVYQTLTHPSGHKKTYYYAPQEREWHELLRDNLVRKAKALGWENDAAAALRHATFKPLRVTSKDQKILRYKGNVIKGWLGRYEISGVPPAYFELLYDAGLGAKNSQGFGMVEVISQATGSSKGSRLDAKDC